MFIYNIYKHFFIYNIYNIYKICLYLIYIFYYILARHKFAKISIYFAINLLTVDKTEDKTVAKLTI